MNAITLRRTASGWIAIVCGPWAEDFRTAWGTHVLKLKGFTLHSPSNVVRETVERIFNPSAVIIVES